MPIFDQGYQHWQGELSGHAWRWLTIARQGVRTGLRNRWVRIATLVALIPALVLAAFLVIWGLAEQSAEQHPSQGILKLLPFLPAAVQDKPRDFRVPVWTLAYHYFFQNQLFFCMLLVLLVGPSLISQDLRFNAIPLYFSRPLRRFDYFVGKLGVIGVFLGAVAILPAVVAYVLGISFSPELGVVKDTLRILGAGILYGLVVVLSAGTLMLAISSLSRNSRYVGATWIGLWLISYVTAGVLTETVRSDWCPAVSYIGNLKRVGEVLLDTETAHKRFREALEAMVADPGAMGMPPAARVARPESSKGVRQSKTTPLDDSGRAARLRSQPADPTPPWYLSAGILAGLFGLSLWTLMFRVRSLDRLR